MRIGFNTARTAHGIRIVDANRREIPAEALPANIWEVFATGECFATLDECRQAYPAHGDTAYRQIKGARPATANRWKESHVNA